MSTQPALTASKTAPLPPQLASLLFANVCEDDLASYTTEELEKVACIAKAALFAYFEKEPPFYCCTNRARRNGKEIETLTIVSENKPFLLGSVLNVFNEQVVNLYFVAHPVIDIIYNLQQNCLHFTSAPPQAGEVKKRISVMQFHFSTLPKETLKKIEEAVDLALNHLNFAVRDWQLMVQNIKDITQSYEDCAPQQCKKEAGQVAQFLDWLTQDHFTFLGLQHYCLKDGVNNAGKLKAGFGILSPECLHLQRNHAFEVLPEELISLLGGEELLVVTKANARSYVHRPVWLDYIGLKLFDEKGAQNGEIWILGLFTSTAYMSSVFDIPYLQRKAKNVIKSLGFDDSDHSGKALRNILETYPRDELFRTDVNTLIEKCRLIAELEERPRLRVLSHIALFGNFVSVLVYLPRDRYDASVCDKIAAYLLEVYEGDSFEFYPVASVGPLMRLRYVIHRKEGALVVHKLRQALEKDIGALTQKWQDSIYLLAAQRECGEGVVKLATSFPDVYRDSFTPEEALQDGQHIAQLVKEGEACQFLAYFYQGDPNRVEKHDKNSIYLKLFYKDSALSLSERVPLLENLGFKVISEQSFALSDGQAGKIWLHLMLLESKFFPELKLDQDLAERLAQVFSAVLRGDADNDGFNALVQTVGLDWRKVEVLRAYGRYLQQAGVPYSQQRLAKALTAYPELCGTLFRLFCLKFAPDKGGCVENNETEKKILDKIELKLQQVPNLEDDVILRHFRDLILATLRTNAFVVVEEGQERPLLAFKFASRNLASLPDPKPFREIFVYGTQVEGIHLRFGPVARGGIRWSDRALDYRTEVLGLVRAQQVKNVVIVPVGAKGGFYPHHLPQTQDRTLLSEAGEKAYKLYIKAMLSITDNLIEGQLIPPEGVVRLDGDDPYFVVAADKGTATFSDAANAISQAQKFWLDDAFASGGSVGYDHKAMGITAKGGWVSVKRWFRERFERNIDEESFTCVGIGDMSGDVFGNGMLLSRKTRLIAAFDHRDIFVDPNPDEEISYQERKRLFDLPRSSWQDYDREKISAGGGVFSRSQKVINLSDEAAQAIGFSKKSGTPFEIMRAILQADIDLLWFGGIGTYVCASGESEIQIGDRANDAVRINGKQLRAKIVAEGANLGMTQKGRVEYSLCGGCCDTDAIDNSAGVNCSDVEVNIKIAFASAMRDGRLTYEERNQLLKAMTPQVEQLVLENNYRQTLALSLAQLRKLRDTPFQAHFMSDLEKLKMLDRKIENLPDTQTLQARLRQGNGLTRPEIAVILAYAKLTLKESLARDVLVEDDYFKRDLFRYFPSQMQKDFAEDIEAHPLRSSIIATILANDIINNGGPTFVHRLSEKTGASKIEVVRAYIAVRDGFSIAQLYQQLDALDNKIAGMLQNQLYASVTTMLFDTTDLFISSGHSRCLPEAQGHGDALAFWVKILQEARAKLSSGVEALLPNFIKEILQKKRAFYSSLPLEEKWLEELLLLELAPSLCDIAFIAYKTKSDLRETAQIYYALMETFRLDLLEQASDVIPIIDYYDGMALEQANDTIAKALRDMVVMILEKFPEQEDKLSVWLATDKKSVETTKQRLFSLLEGDLNISRFTVAAGMLADLARLSTKDNYRIN